MPTAFSLPSLPLRLLIESYLTGFTASTSPSERLSTRPTPTWPSSTPGRSSRSGTSFRFVLAPQGGGCNFYPRDESCLCAYVLLFVLGRPCALSRHHGDAACAWNSSRGVARCGRLGGLGYVQRGSLDFTTLGFCDGGSAFSAFAAPVGTPLGLAVLVLVGGPVMCFVALDRHVFKLKPGTRLLSELEAAGRPG